MYIKSMHIANYTNYAAPINPPEDTWLPLTNLLNLCSMQEKPEK